MTEYANVCPHFGGYCKCSEIVRNNMECDIADEESCGCAYLGVNPITKDQLNTGVVDINCEGCCECECSMNVYDYINWNGLCTYKG